MKHTQPNNPADYTQELRMLAALGQDAVDATADPRERIVLITLQHMKSTGSEITLNTLASKLQRKQTDALSAAQHLFGTHIGHPSEDSIATREPAAVSLGAVVAPSAAIAATRTDKASPPMAIQKSIPISTIASMPVSDKESTLWPSHRRLLAACRKLYKEHGEGATSRMVADELGIKIENYYETKRQTEIALGLRKNGAKTLPAQAIPAIAEATATPVATTTNGHDVVPHTPPKEAISFVVPENYDGTNTHNARPSLGTSLTLSEWIAMDRPENARGIVNEAEWEDHYRKQLQVPGPIKKYSLNGHPALHDAIASGATQTGIVDATRNYAGLSETAKAPKFIKKVSLDGRANISEIIARDARTHSDNAAEETRNGYTGQALSSRLNRFDMAKAKLVTINTLDQVPNKVFLSLRLTDREKLLIEERNKFSEDMPVTEQMMADAMAKVLRAKTTIVMVKHLESTIRDKLIAFAYNQAMIDRGRS